MTVLQWHIALVVDGNIAAGDHSNVVASSGRAPRTVWEVECSEGLIPVEESVCCVLSVCQDTCNIIFWGEKFAGEGCGAFLVPLLSRARC